MIRQNDCFAAAILKEGKEFVDNIFKTITYKETGIRHIERGKACEDSVFNYTAKDGVTSIALSDGAGSYKYAELGSKITSEVAAKFMAEKFDRLYELDKDTIVEYIQHEILVPINEAAAEKDEESIQFSATLLCVAIHPDGRYLVIHIGDGAIVGLNHDNECKVISIYEHDGPVNQTTFVTIPGTEAFAQKGKSDYATFVLMSDGPEDFLVNEQGASTRVRLMQQLAFFLEEEAMQRQFQSLTELLVSKGMDDDASFAIICDTRRVSDMLINLTPKFREMLFSLDQDLSDSKKKRSRQVLDIIAEAPNGITLKELTRKMHVHSPSVAKKKIEFLYSMGLIKKENGRIMISI